MGVEILSLLGLSSVFGLIGLVLAGWMAWRIVEKTGLPLAVGLSVSVGLLWLTARPLLLGIGLALFALAPTLVVALNEAALGLDHPEVVVRILPIRLGHDAITR